MLAAKLVEAGRLSATQAKQWATARINTAVDKPIAETDAAEIKHLIGLYYAEKAANMVDELWEKNAWTAETMHSWVQEHMRTSYRRESAA